MLFTRGYTTQHQLATTLLKSQTSGEASHQMVFRLLQRDDHRIRDQMGRLFSRERLRSTVAHASRHPQAQRCRYHLAFRRDALAAPMISPLRVLGRTTTTKNFRIPFHGVLDSLGASNFIGCWHISDAIWLRFLLRTQLSLYAGLR